MSLGRWSRERGKEAEQEGDQHGLKDDDQFDEGRGGENKENKNNGEKQVVLTRLRNKKRPPPLTIVDHKEPGEESSRLEQVDHYHLDRQILSGLGDLRLASLPSPPVVVHERGFLSLALSHGVTVDLTPRQALRVSNPVQASSIAISSCGRQLAFLHPTGRMLQYGPRIELQVEDELSVKNAKIWPKGTSFTATTCALVYLLDEAGLRTTTDIFHDLFASDIVDSLWEQEFWSGSENVATTARMRECREMFEGACHWRSGETDCWEVGGIRVNQGEDGLVVVERINRGESLMVRSSPCNGRIKLSTEFLFATASRGEEEHIYIRSGSRRIHYSGQSTAFTVRQGGKSGGFDQDGFLRIY